MKSALRLLIPVTMFAAVTPSVGHAQTSVVLTLEQSTNALTGWQTIRTIATSGPFSPPAFYRMRIVMTNNSPTNMARIAAGSFSMGNSHSAVGDGYSGELPVHTVNVSAFYIDKYEVTKTLWDEVANWAAANGYDISAASADGNAADHPAYSVTWYEAVKWCNARSEKEGLTPCYTVSGVVMKTGTSNPDCNFAVSGYRLPTEAEWEKAARGGLSGQRFPWGGTISHSQANYYSDSSYSYDVSPTLGFHPTYAAGPPYSSPVASFSANGYEL
ncbi:MAG: formylglycine-generating enzyme family protein, partial [Flavobacteriales bacterium]